MSSVLWFHHVCKLFANTNSNSARLRAHFHLGTHPHRQERQGSSHQRYYNRKCAPPVPIPSPHGAAPSLSSTEVAMNVLIPLTSHRCISERLAPASKARNARARCCPGDASPSGVCMHICSGRAIELLECSDVNAYWIWTCAMA